MNARINEQMEREALAERLANHSPLRPV